MRSAGTVSGPLLSISTPASQQNRFAAVHLLTGQLLYFIAEGKSRVKEVYSQLAGYMLSEGMLDIELFALAFILDDEYFFADPESKLSKYSPKSWKSSSTYGLDQNGQPLLQLHLRVKFYVDTTKSLRDELTRQHYYLQLRKNIADRGGSTEDGYQNVLPLVALSLQTDLGDYTADTDITSELLEQYIPLKVYKYNEHKVKQTLCSLYKSHKGISKTRAQAMLVQEIGPVHKSHLYRLRFNKSQPKQTPGSPLSACNSVWLAICTSGIQLFHETITQSLSGLYLWNNIVKLCFDRKKFELRPSNADRLVYYTNSDDKSKRLLSLCRETHQFCMLVHPRLLDTACFNNNTTDKNALDGLKWINEKKSKSLNGNDTIDGKKCENNCSDSNISTTDQKTTSPKEKESNGSISSSVELGYSHTAQNSTVSELDYSVQSAQDSSDAYLMYRHPRARAAYVENSNQSAHTSSGVYTCASYSTASKDGASASYTTENCCSSVDCNGSSDGYKSTAAAVTTQSSATLSSTGPPDTDSAYSPSLPPDTIAASSTCADDDRVVVDQQQVTAVDDCDGAGVDDGDELYDLSAAATSDSSYCVGGGGGATTATTASDVGPSSTSSKCGNAGCGNGRCVMDGYGADNGGGGGRSRSGSVVSNSGSFRGDGSDPSEGGRGALLSADDLSDLIVGRKSLQTPRKGFYPSRPTTSSTLDSDSDYVTLPPPINFLTGAPSLSNLSLANFDCGTGSGTVTPWEVRRSFDLLTSVVKFCGGHHHHDHHHTNQCVVNSNNYLDVHKSGNTFYHHVIYPTPVAPVPPSHLRARQPPPPPPPPPPPRPRQYEQQLEQYRQQLRSDVDFVVYPHQDPTISRQEYADAKLANLSRNEEQYKRYFGCDPPKPSYRANAQLYRSTPNVAMAAAVSPPPPPPPPLSSSSTSSSSMSLKFQYQKMQKSRRLQRERMFQRAPPPPLPPMPPHLKLVPPADLAQANLMYPVAVVPEFAVMMHNQRRLQQPPKPVRTYSHDDLLAAASVAPAVPPKLLFRRRPPPPPPPVADLQKPVAVTTAPTTAATTTPTTAATTAAPRTRRVYAVDVGTSTSPVASPKPSVSAGSGTVLDIESLREKSRTYDLPLIAALCNDQTLLKQTNALVTNKSTQTVTAAAQPNQLPTPWHQLPTYSQQLSSSSYQLPSTSSYQPPSTSSYQPPSTSSYQQPSTSSYQLPSSIGSANKSNNTSRCTNGASSYSSPPPPNFLSCATSSSTAAATAVAADKVAKSKTNAHIV